MADPIQFDEELNLGSRGGVAAWLEYAATIVTMGVVSRLPHACQMALLRPMASLAMRLDKRHTRGARSYMAQAMGEEAASEDWRIRQAYVHLGRMSLDAEAFDRKVPQSKLLDHYDVKMAPEVEAYVRTGKGAIIVGAHIGDWEAGAAIMAHVGMGPAYIVAKPPKNRYLSRHLLRLRLRKRVTVVPRRGGMKQTAAILASGGWMALLLDQRPLGKHAIAPFFGRLTTCERSAGVLIKRMGVPIVFAGCYLTDRPFHYEMSFPRLIAPEELDGLSLEEVVAVVNAQLETMILKQPEQYFWLHDRYRDAPPLETEEEPAEGPSPAIPSR